MKINRDSIVMFGSIAVMMASVLGISAVVGTPKFVASEVVLSPAGCAAVNQHGAKVEPLPGSELCALRAEYAAGGWANQHATLRVDVGQGKETIELRVEDVVSRSDREG